MKHQLCVEADSSVPPMPSSLHLNSTGLSCLVLRDGVASSHTLPTLLFPPSLSVDTFIQVLLVRLFHKPNAEQMLLNVWRNAMRGALG